MRARLRRTVATQLVLAGLALGATAPSTSAPTSDCASEVTSDARARDEGPAWLGALPPDEPVVAVAVHDGPPPPATTEALRALGLAVQPLRHLPLSIVRGDPAQLLRVADVAGVRDLRPDRPLELHSRTSTTAIGADRVWADHGVTGAGVGVAVVDSGVDATHPAFEGRVRRNVKVLGPGYLEGAGVPVPPGAPLPDILVALEDTPYSNTDVVGHGTHVAGIVAAADIGGDEEDSPAGVAPGAHLLAYAVGEISTVTAIAAFDDILEQHDDPDSPIHIVNNSWGDRFSLFDPGDPINVATRELADAGLVVTFSAGNLGEEMTLNPFAVAPWVIGVGSSSLAGQPSTTSSGGLRGDNASGPPAADGHARFQGERIGLYHPDITAPGEHILSTTAPTGAVFPPGPHLPGGTATASGTSMANPHVAGVAALLLEARPDLTPGQVEQVLEATATPPSGATLWKAGYGSVDAYRAVELVRSPAFRPEALEAVHEGLTAARLSSAERPALVSDHWSLTATGPVSIAGTQRHCFTFTVEPGPDLVRAGVAFAGSGDGVALNRNDLEWSLTLRDAAGTVVGRSAPQRRVGVSWVEVDLVALGADVAYGAWSVDVVAERAVAGPRPLFTDPVSVVVTQLGPAREEPDAGGTTELLLGAGDPTAVTSPEGCTVTGTDRAGTLGGPADAACRATTAGVLWSDTAGASTFVSAPLDAPIELSGTAELVLYLVDGTAEVWQGHVGSRVRATLELLPPGGGPGLVVGTIATPALVGPDPVRGSYDLPLAATTAPAGSRLQLRLDVTGAQASTVRLLTGGPYDSGLVLPVPDLPS